MADGPSWAFRLLRALGVFAIVTIGIHAGADRLDDHAFLALHFVDGLFDAAAERVIPFTLGGLGASPAEIEAAVLEAIELVDLDGKLWASQVLALGVEALVWALLALPVLSPESRLGSWTDLRLAARTSPTIAKLAGPLAMVLAATAAAIVLGHDLSSALADLGSRAGLSIRTAVRAAGILGFAFAVVAAALLGGRAALGALLRADRRAAADLARGAPRLARQTRGLVVLVLGVPVAILAVIGAIEKVFGGGA